MHDKPIEHDLPIDRDKPVRVDVGLATDRADFEPVPARFWWLKRIGVAVGVLIVALAVLRGVWG